MTMPASEAVCPAGISSFFEVCDTNRAGKSIDDPARIGARGGGFAISKGVKAKVFARKASRSRINIRINSKPAPEAQTTRWAISEVLKATGAVLDVRVHLKVKVPIGSGFGTSAAGTLASCLALANAADFPVTMNELGRITHISEVINKTGLGTASAMLTGGFVLVTEPGAPGVGSVDRLLFPEDHLLLCVYLGPISTRDVLSRSDLANIVNPAARTAMEKIRRKPELSTFLNETRHFGEIVGFQTAEVRRLLNAVVATGAVGAAQNMIGRAVHGVVQRKKARRAIDDLRRRFPSALVFTDCLDSRGVRII
jgi:pantoate kinase